MRNLKMLGMAPPLLLLSFRLRPVKKANTLQITRTQKIRYVTSSTRNKAKQLSSYCFRSPAHTSTHSSNPTDQKSFNISRRQHKHFAKVFSEIFSMGAMLISTWNQNLLELSSQVVGSVNCAAPSTPSLSLESESLGVEMNIWREKTFDKSFMDESCLLGRWRILRKKMESFLCAQWMEKGASLKAPKRSELDDSAHSSHIFLKKKEETPFMKFLWLKSQMSWNMQLMLVVSSHDTSDKKLFTVPKPWKNKLWQISMLAQIELWWKIVVDWNDIEKNNIEPRHTKKRFDKAEKNMYVESCKTPTTAKLALENYVQQANIMMKLLCVQNSLSPQNFTFLQLHTSLSLTASFDRAASSCSR